MILAIHPQLRLDDKILKVSWSANSFIDRYLISELLRLRPKCHTSLYFATSLNSRQAAYIAMLVLREVCEQMRQHLCILRCPSTERRRRGWGMHFIFSLRIRFFSIRTRLCKLPYMNLILWPCSCFNCWISGLWHQYT